MKSQKTSSVRGGLKIVAHHASCTTPVTGKVEGGYIDVTPVKEDATSSSATERMRPILSDSAVSTDDTGKWKDEVATAASEI